MGGEIVLGVEPRRRRSGRVCARDSHVRWSRERVGVVDVASDRRGGDLRVLSHSRYFSRRVLRGEDCLREERRADGFGDEVRRS